MIKEDQFQFIKPNNFEVCRCPDLSNEVDFFLLQKRQVFLNRQRKLRYFCTTASSAAPQIPSTVSGDAGIEPATVATSEMAVRRSDFIQPRNGITAADICCFLN